MTYVLFVNSLKRGLLCGTSYTVGTHLSQTPFQHETFWAMTVYGFITFPIIFYNFKYTRGLQRTFNRPAIINECVLWPLNTLPLLYFTKHVAERSRGNTYDGLQQYVTDVVPVTFYSAMFWVPFTSLQYKFPLQRFAPIRFPAGFTYNTMLTIYQNKNTI